MFTRVRLIFIFAAIFLVSFFLFFVSGLLWQLPREASATIDGSSKQDDVIFLADFVKARELAFGERKPLIVFFTLPNNESCKRSMELFNNQEISRLAKYFVCVSVDGIASGSICDLYRVNGFPTVLILNSDGKEIQRLTGKETKEQLSIQIHIAIQIATNADKNKIR